MAYLSIRAISDPNYVLPCGTISQEAKVQMISIKNHLILLIIPINEVL